MMPPLGKNMQVTLLGLVTFYLLQVAFPQFDTFVHSHLLVSASRVLADFQVWTLLTSVLWHGSPGHLFANGLALFFFGGYVEARWSDRQFWVFCLICALGSGVTIVLSQAFQALFWSLYTGPSYTFWQVLPLVSNPTIGYSGVVTGLLAAFAYFMWDRPFHLFMFEMTGKTFFFAIIFLDVLRVCAGSNVSFAGHLGGLLVGLAATHFWFSEGASAFGTERTTADEFQKELLAEAEAALEAEDFSEAYRLCHQLRQTGGALPGEMLETVWEILAVSATRLEKFDEAESYVERAPETARVRDARERLAEAER